MITTIIFDWMGTLGGAEDIGSFSEHLTSEQKNSLLINNFEDAKIPEGKKEIIKSFLDGAILTLYEDSEEIIKRLKEKGFSLAIISNMYPITTERVRKQFGNFLENFDVVNLSAEIGLIKPNEDIFANTLEKLNIKLKRQITLKEVIVIGDNVINDVETPKKLGMKARLINRKIQQLDDVLKDLLI